MKYCPDKHIARIQTTLLHSWDGVLGALKSKLDQYEVVNFDDETVQYAVPDSALLYTFMVVGHKRIVLCVEDHVSDMSYEIELSKFGPEVKMVFTGEEKYFMTNTMAYLLYNMNWNRFAIREIVEIVNYD